MTESTMEDVARRAGVSVSTVSRALRGSDLVSPETAARVRAAADELSFAVSRAASSLATGKLNRVAVLVSGSLGTWFNGTLLDSVYATLHRAGQELLIYRTLDSAERDEFFATLPARRNADALIVASLELTAAQRSRLRELGMPLVYVNQRVRGAAAVSIDDAAGAAGATRHLLGLGHRRIAFVGWAHAAGTHPSSADRLSGYWEVMAEVGIAVSAQRVITAGHRDEGESVVSEFLGSSPRPTGLVVESDELAMSVLVELSRVGVRVPESLSVIGFDGHAMADKFGLSTVAQPVDQLGRQASELALSLTGSAPGRRKSIMVPTRLVLRNSTAPPPDGSVERSAGH
jgi:DNA-binding LacI/PurR family transcriptional regulator